MEALIIVNTTRLTSRQEGAASDRSLHWTTSKVRADVSAPALSDYSIEPLMLIDRARHSATPNSALAIMLGLTAGTYEAGVSFRRTIQLLSQWIYNYTAGESVQSLRQQVLDAIRTGKKSCNWESENGMAIELKLEAVNSTLLLCKVKCTGNTGADQSSVEVSEASLLHSVLSSVDDAVYAVDRENRILVANQAAAVGFGFPDPLALTGLSLSRFVSEQRYSTVKAEHRSIIHTGVPITSRHADIGCNQPADNRSLRVKKSVLCDEHDKPMGVVVRTTDVSQISLLSEKLSHQAEHDATTGLLNRQGFHRRLWFAVQDYAETGRHSVLCYLDLDQFRVVNDTAGHRMGDRLLLDLSQRLRTLLRQSDTLARLGGDEFGIIFSGCEFDSVESQIARLLAEIRDFVFRTREHVLGVTGSMGVVEVGDVADTVQTLLAKADVACFTAKELGRDRFHLYSEEDESTCRRRSELEQAAEIRTALVEKRFALFVQPIVSSAAQGNENCHYEVLVRMKNRNGELIPPGLFIPAAERFDLMADVDRWVIENCFTQLRKHPAADSTVFSINLSGNSLNDRTMPEFIRNCVSKHCIDPRRIVFELTETAFVNSLTTAQHFVAGLRAQGFGIALDDFGSGLSSFAYLKSFPIDYLKIDGSFVRQIIDNQIDRDMVKAIKSIGHALGVKTIAEFVESKAHAKIVTDLGVDYLQGYAIGRPVEFESLFNRENHSPSTSSVT